MPLITLQTNLKSLKYGLDRPDGGSSNEPYVQNDINDPKLIVKDNNIQDGFIRGGFSAALRSSTNDLKRITKYIKNNPLFIARQVGLQLSNPRLETKKGAFPTGGGLLGMLQPTRIYNAGLNTLAQVPVNAFGVHFNRHGLLPVQNENTKYESVVRSNAGIPNSSTDEAIKKNRLLVLRDKLQIGQNQQYTSLREVKNINRANQKQYNKDLKKYKNQLKEYEERKSNYNAAFLPYQQLQLQISQLKPKIIRTTGVSISTGTSVPNGISTNFINTTNIVSTQQQTANILSKTKLPPLPPPLGPPPSAPNKPIKLSTASLIIDQYSGGPGSVYGIGQTTIKRYEFTNNPDPILLSPGVYAGLTRDSNGSPIPIKIGNTADFDISTRTFSIFAPSTFDLSASINLDTNLAQVNNPGPFPDPTDPKNININYSNDLGVSLQYFGGQAYTTAGSGILSSTQKPSFLDQATYAGGAANINGDVIPNVYDPRTKTFNPATPVISNIPVVSADYTAYQKIINNRRLTSQPINIKTGSISVPANQFNIFATGSNGRTNPNSYSTSNQDSIYYINTYNDVTKVNFKNWSKISRENRIGSGRKDAINLTPIFSGLKSFGNDSILINGLPYNIRDLIRFRIQAVDGINPDSGNWMVFRAYLTDLSDDTNSEWSDIKYAGRGDKFYIYNGFTRKINISFKIAALSVEEMKFIYNKLNYLMSNAMPDYNGVLMRGPLIRMTVGNWIDAQLGVLNSINLKIPQDSPWEINLDGPEGGASRLVLPHVVEVSMAFTPIGSETDGVNRLSQKSRTISNIAQNNTGNSPRLQYV